MKMKNLMNLMNRRRLDLNIKVKQQLLKVNLIQFILLLAKVKIKQIQ